MGNQEDGISFQRINSGRFTAKLFMMVMLGDRHEKNVALTT